MLLQHVALARHRVAGVAAPAGLGVGDAYTTGRVASRHPGAPVEGRIQGLAAGRVHSSSRVCEPRQLHAPSLQVALAPPRSVPTQYGCRRSEARRAKVPARGTRRQVRRHLPYHPVLPLHPPLPLQGDKLIQVSPSPFHASEQGRDHERSGDRTLYGNCVRDQQVRWRRRHPGASPQRDRQPATGDYHHNHNHFFTQLFLYYYFYNQCQPWRSLWGARTRS